MIQTILLAPTCKEVSLYTVSIGFVKALTDQGLKVSFLTPFSHKKQKEEIVDLEESLNNYKKPLSASLVKALLSRGEQDKIIDFILNYVKENSHDCDIIVVEGIPYTEDSTFASQINNHTASSLSADVVLITTLRSMPLAGLSEHLKIAGEKFTSIAKDRILGYILNKAGAPVDQYGNTRIDLFDPPKNNSFLKESLPSSPFPLIAMIPWKRELMSTDIKGIAEHLDAAYLNKGTLNNNPILHFILAAATLEFFTPALKKGALIITSGDRSDIIIATCMAYLSGIEISGLVLTGNHHPTKSTLDLCKAAMDKGFPLLLVKTDSLRTSIALQNMGSHIANKEKRLEKVKKYIASKIDIEWIKKLSKNHPEYTKSPAAFKFYLIEKAKKLNKTIVLPEGDDMRILSAANFCSKKEIAHIIILGDLKKIHALCQKNGCTLDEKIKVIDPQSASKKYLAPLLELRKHKGLTEQAAIEYLQDPIVVGMMMLEAGEVDGLVAGANTTTAKVVSPALKILKTSEGAKLVSSIFFMCLENEVIVYGDCAINQNPTADGLADIAIQSATSAQKFDIDPKVAMISYSTGSSGSGADVEKVKEAVKIIKEKSADLVVDGPLQYDAAKSPDVAKIKAPNSPVAGQATVFIFPDLNTANTTYKAVQRTAGVLSIGPVLQGLRKPVNDLSRGATVDDIIYTIAITVIQ